MSLQVEELAALSLNQPVRLFVDNNTDVAHNLRQEFVRIRSNREEDRLAIVTGTVPHSRHTILPRLRAVPLFQLHVSLSRERKKKSARKINRRLVKELCWERGTAHNLHIAPPPPPPQHC